ncbi:hypothetical protein GGR57DRAFT_502253 [Xylariaceae sp. FL1272]|nr:hypothetical protein GGR57DRAFT_502253 [Xylariaceae sp. FL1272]
MDLDQTPSVPPPPGRSSDFIHPEDRSYQLIILISVLSAVIAALIPMRVYTRLKSTRAFGADDCSHAVVLFSDTEASPGGGILGIHLWDAPVSHYYEYQKTSPLKGSLADSILIRITNTTIKIAFFVFYLRLFGHVTHVKYMTWAGIVVVTVFCVVFVVLDAGTLAFGSALTNVIVRSDSKLFDRSDLSWTIIPVYATTLVEINVGLIADSSPVIFVLFVGRFRKIHKSLSSWLRERRSPHASPHTSANDSTTRINAEDDAPRLSPVPEVTSF